jgi:SAM-dependent methyltransferase
MVDGRENVEVYNAPEVVEHYAKASGLQSAEIYAFDKFIPVGATILDIGVGGGRTTSYLSAIASRYLGVDYAASMVLICQTRFPDLEFICEDATDLSSIPDNSFDIVVFSINGIDSIPTDDGRHKCFAEVFRVLRRGGKFIFSSHNARVLGVWPILDGIGPVKKGWRILRAFGKSAQLTLRQLRANVFHRGCGYIFDPVHGGLTLYTATPRTIEPEVCSVGFELIEVIQHPRTKNVLPAFFVGWYYYVLLKP